MKHKTDFIKIDKYSRESGARRHPKEIEMIGDFPQSDKVLVECTGTDCTYTGSVIKYYGWNTYYKCPECGDDSMVVSS